MLCVVGCPSASTNTTICITTTTQAQIPAASARADTTTTAATAHKGPTIPPHRSSLDGSNKQGPAPPQPPQPSGAYMAQDTVLSYRNAAVAAGASGQGTMGGGNPALGGRQGPVQPPPPPPAANGKHAYVQHGGGGGGGQYASAAPPGYGAPPHAAATTPTATKVCFCVVGVVDGMWDDVVWRILSSSGVIAHAHTVCHTHAQMRPEGVLESPGLDDFAHLGLITDLLE